MAVTVNVDSITKKVAGSKKFANTSKNRVKKALKIVSQEMMKEFDSHEVTREIQGGKTYPNITNTLGGRGNLFTFIGFNEGSDPIEPVRSVLLNTVQLVKQTSHAKSGGKVQVRTKIKFPSPTLADFNGVATLPRQGGSWVKGIENGISGFGSYIYWKYAGMSGKGLQAKSANGNVVTLRGGDYKPTRYLTEIIEKYIEKAKKLKKV